MIQKHILWAIAGAALLGRAQIRPALDHSAFVDRLPFRFEENRGQVAAAAPFIATGPDYRFEASPTRNVLTWTDKRSRNSASLDTRFVGATSRARLLPESPMAATTNYFLGRSPKNWHTGIPNYARLRVSGIYPGIDLVYHGTGGGLEYDFEVQPGARSESIAFEVGGAKHIHLTAEGDLVLAAGAGEVRWKKPVLYQVSPNGRDPIQGGFELTPGGRVRFHVGDYDRRRTLVIDPTLAYATYFGGPEDTQIGFEKARGIGVDAAGNVYVAGISAANDLPVTPGVVQTAFGGYTANLRYLTGDAFIAKFTAAGAISYVTYLGGKGDDAALALAVDSAGNSYVTGSTNSSDFPVTSGVLQQSLKGSGGNFCTIFGDAFVAKLNPSGTSLLYSTYLGGSLDDAASAIAVDGQGNAYVAGATLSTDFPTVNPFQATMHGSGGEPGRPSCGGAPLFDLGDAFVAKLNPTATSLVFSTYLGGSMDDGATAIALDSAQNVYVGGFTLSQNFPTTRGAKQTAYHGVDQDNEFFHTGDGFVAKLNSSGATLAYSTFLGGSGDDAVWGLATDKAGTVYAAGSTSSPDFPVTSGAVQTDYGGYTLLPELIEQNFGDGFVARLDTQGATLLYSTYLGGSANDGALAVALDPSGLIYLTGMTDSKDFPVTKDALQPTFGGDSTSVRTNYLPSGDGFLTIIDPNLPTPVYSTYYGGEYNDVLQGITLDSNGNVWMAGYTESPNLNVTANAAQKTYTGFPASHGGISPSSLIVGEAMVVEFSTAATTNGPVLQDVINAASGKGGVVSPGMIFVAYGGRLGPANLIGSAVDPASGLLSSTISGTSVLFDNVAAPLVYVTANAVAGTVPYEVAGSTSAQMVVEVEGQRSAPITVQVQPTAPGLFSLNESGAGPAAADNYLTSHGTLNSSSNPAPIGAVMAIYATGEGQTDPPGQDGLSATSTVPKPVAHVSVTIGGVPQTKILYAGAIPGEVPGVLQVNFMVAEHTPHGVQPIVVTIGGASSQAGITVAIK